MPPRHMVEMVMDSERPIRNPILLIAADNPCEAVVRNAFSETGLLDHLQVISNCRSALIHLQGCHKNRPCLILLDLEMPQPWALRFIQCVKADSVLRMIPIVVLAGSDNDEDVAAWFGLGVAGYLVKSADPSIFREKIMGACGYWKLSRMPLA